jgi:hypothetical protein
MQRLIETEEKGRGLALFGWAGVAVFAFVAAFASWQFAPGRSAVRIARSQDVGGDITGSIRNGVRQGTTGSVPTVPAPTPLPGESVVSATDLELFRNDMKEMRRVIGRIDATSDVLARRISNLEDAIASGSVAAVKRDEKPLQPLVPIAPVSSMAPPGAAQPMPPPIATQPKSQPQPSPMRAPSAVPPVQPTRPPDAAALVPPPAPMNQPTRNQPLIRPQPTPERQGADKAELERMLLQRARQPDPDTADPLAGLLPPVPDPVSIVPKSHQQVQVPVVTRDPPKPPSAETTGTIRDRTTMPIDPSKAVPVPVQQVAPIQQAASQAAKPEPAKPDAAKPVAGDPPQPAPVQTASVAAATPEPPKANETFGFDLGGYKSVNQVRKVWFDLQIRQEKLTKSLVPLAKLAEAADGVDIRLIAGPFLDKEAARRACVAMRGAAAKCDVIAYAGEPLVTKPAAGTAKPIAPPAAVTHPKPLRLSPANVSPPKT